MVIDSGEVSLHYESSLAEFLTEFSSAGAVVVDVPIGLPIEGRRLADQEARRFVGPRASSVFTTPPLGPLLSASYQEALQLCRDQHGYGLSSQSYALRDKILEADALALTGPPVLEGHPEVSFAALKGSHLGYPKRTWNGQMERRRLLAQAGIHFAR